MICRTSGTSIFLCQSNGGAAKSLPACIASGGFNINLSGFRAGIALDWPNAIVPLYNSIAKTATRIAHLLGKRQCH
jgi:hypothetical protein